MEVVASMYTASTSGLSSRSTLMLTKCSLRYAAVASSSNDSCAITWHQWQAASPTLSRTGTLRRRASSNAAGSHSHQSTGLSACWRRYGEVAEPSRFIFPRVHEGRRSTDRRPWRVASDGRTRALSVRAVDRLDVGGTRRPRHEHRAAVAGG